MKKLLFLVLLASSFIGFAATSNAATSVSPHPAFLTTAAPQSIYTHYCERHCWRGRHGVLHCHRHCW
ncbi:MAG: hypothetical protein JSR17_06515 [Proteobacteria bacterium]|nr:hypothetical protein [Pseudomonadota bacterium]